MAPVERKRRVRSVTLDEVGVERARTVAKKLVPPEENLSRIIDRALAEFVERYRRKGSSR